MPFNQRVRLPFLLTQAQFPASSSVFRLANGSLKVQSAQVRKTYEGKTDYMPEWWHQVLRVALMHDNVVIEGNRLVGRVAMEGDAYEIDWQDFLDYPTAPAAFTVQVDNFDFTNSNCISCEEASQLDLTDDNLGIVAEGDAGAGNVFTNDDIFCSPVVASITSYSTIYLAAPPTIDNAGAVSFVLNSPLPDVTAANIFTYRVTCPGGAYDEANVFIDIDGSLAGCSPPENVRDANPPNPNDHIVTWDTNGSPADGYYWELYREDNLGAIVLSNTPPLIGPMANMTGLESCTDYRIFVRAVCDTGVSESEFAQLTFSTPCPPESCGQYEVFYDDGTANRSTTSFTFRNCNDVYRTMNITNTQSRIVCMRESSPGEPTEISGGFTSINYLGTC